MTTECNPLGWRFNEQYNPFVSVTGSGMQFWTDKFKSAPDPENPAPVPRAYTQYERDFMEQSKHYYDSGRD